MLKKLSLLPFIIASCLAAAVAQSPDQALIPFRAGSKWGYSDKAGKLVIPARYNAARPFSEGLALVMSGGKYGFIDAAGREVIKPAYQSAGDFGAGLAPVKLKGSWGYIDKAGKI